MYREKWAKAVEDAEYLSEKHPEIKYDEAAYIKFCCVRRWLKREQQRQIDMGRIVVEKADEVNNLKTAMNEKLYSFDYVGRRRCLIPGSPSLHRRNA
ncbi:hypothetical protein CAEBREN_11832 [Caenorhabditis brenneri]|uniref:Uncharacterized protein n=1 Tax=Caenorhabditis brenneri TaxID=135651 RepID=G0P4G5_CAEBE|nr:hypothetical protein CAEBREN_11832 [Caenorhabditis brenneri]